MEEKSLMGPESGSSFIDPLSTAPSPKKNIAFRFTGGGSPNPNWQMPLSCFLCLKPLGLWYVIGSKRGHVAFPGPPGFVLTTSVRGPSASVDSQNNGVWRLWRRVS